MPDRDSRDSPDPPGPPPDDEFRRLLQEIPGWSAKLGTGRWHCAQDVEDEFLRILEDHLLKRTKARPLRPWAYATYKNLVKSDPPKANQRRHVGLDPASVDAGLARMERIDRHAAWIEEFDQILPHAMPRLTSAEQRALSGIRRAATMSQAAEIAHMSPRHLRTRFWRIVGKFTRLREEK